ncbi:MAG: FtsX-like permease family protein, partial [Acidimicrobiia bacterium]
MFNTISVNIAERSGEFATLKANGMADRTIAWMIVGENLLLTAFGIVPGALLGIWISGLFMTSYNNDSFTFELTIRPLTIAVAVLAMFAVAALSMVPGVRSVRRLDIGGVVRERAV